MDLKTLSSVAPLFVLTWLLDKPFFPYISLTIIMAPLEKDSLLVSPLYLLHQIAPIWLFCISDTRIFLLPIVLLNLNDDS
jgi:hypothetical protein